MTKIKMPFATRFVDIPDIEFITTTQAEAYKDACVREVLEAAARRCVESPMMNTDVYCGGTARLCADRILSLIPHNDNEQGK